MKIRELTEAAVPKAKVTDADVLKVQPGDQILMGARRGLKKPKWFELEAQVEDNGKPRKREWFRVGSNSSVTIGGTDADTGYFDYNVYDIKKKGAAATPEVKDEPKVDAAAGDKEFYGLGEWGDPYHKDGEYFLVGPYETKALAKKAVDRRHQNGQPQGFRDWVPGTAKIFGTQEKANAAIKKLKLKEISFDDASFENPSMWRLRKA